MAVPTWDALNAVEPNRPDQVQIYQIPVTTLTPPWPSLRRTVTGDAVARSPVYDQQYVAQAFNTLMGSQPSPSTVQFYVGLLNADTYSLLKTTQFIAISTPVVNAEVSKIYQSFLGHAADSFALSYWGSYLASHSYRQMEAAVAGSAEFSQRAGGSLSQEVIYLYQAILNRTPATSEVNFWASTNLPAGTLATTFLNSTEGITDQWNTIIQAMFGPGTQGLIPPDDLADFSLESHAGVTEAALTSLTLASAGESVGDRLHLRLHPEPLSRRPLSGRERGRDRLLAVVARSRDGLVRQPGIDLRRQFGGEAGLHPGQVPRPPRPRGRPRHARRPHGVPQSRVDPGLHHQQPGILREERQ